MEAIIEKESSRRRVRDAEDRKYRLGDVHDEKPEGKLHGRLFVIDDLDDWLTAGFSST